MTFGLKRGVHDQPQYPQLWTLVAVSMHVPVVAAFPHSMIVLGDELHVHWEAAQVPSPQSRPQDPQWRAFVLRSTHDDPHTVRADKHWFVKLSPNTLAPAKVREMLGGVNA